MSFALSANIAAAATFAAPAHTYTGEAFETLRTRAPRAPLATRRAAGFIAAPRAPAAAFARRG